ncbi:IclR family transcriptional regulator [Paenibacillus cymbidii]|uniref:IclR family transcriptional regulator n=1 Tax=Paenibacillus cymbidii TaxID=1639034 RepID=UPI0010818C76|nr:IclR family transcriptional regulator [Paenibacillus cymbidii]
MGKEPAEKQERYTIQSIDKALDMIELLAERGTLSLIELTELLEQPKSSTYRIVLTLESRGFISRSEEDGKYCLGYKQLMIAKYLLERNSFRTSALQEMKRLSEKYGDSVNLGVLTEGDIMYVEIIEGSYALRMTDTVGSRSPFHATAIGKAIAAHLSEEQVRGMVAEYGLKPYTKYTIDTAEKFMAEMKRIRERGYAIDDQENTLGARCVAAPIFNMQGKVEGAMSMSGAMHRFEQDAMIGIVADVKAACAAASRKMGYHPEIVAMQQTK